MLCTRNSVVALGVLVFCAVSSYAAVFIQPSFSHPAHPERCYDKITKRPMIPGKEYKPKGFCAVMTCNLQQSVIEVETCPSMEMPGCIEIPGNPKLTYPKCCPQFQCTDDNGVTVLFDAASF